MAARLTLYNGLPMMPASKAEFVSIPESLVTLTRFLLHQCEQSDQQHFVEANISCLRSVWPAVGCDVVTPEPDDRYLIKPAPFVLCVAVNRIFFNSGADRPQ